jgi:hypothetical protein
MMDNDEMEEEKQKFDHMFRILLIGDTGRIKVIELSKLT